MQPASRQHRIFLLSPANIGGERARMVLREQAGFDLAVRLRQQGAPLGEVYAFISGLYFRGKLAYVKAFGAAPEGLPAAFVITPGRGLLPPELLVTMEDLRQFAEVPIGADNPRYREPLERHARMLDEMAGPDCQFILLGSLATVKYIEPLIEVFEERLLFPMEFVGRGDMSRGGLMLRCAHSGLELTYTQAAGAARHGPRPPKLPRWKPSS